MKKASYFTVLVVALFVITTSCSGKDAKDKEKVLAEVDGVEITMKDFNDRLQQLQGMAHNNLDADTKKKLLDNLVTRELLLKEAGKRGVDKDEEVVRKLKDVQDDLILRRFLEKEIEQKVSVSSEDIKTYYEKNPNELMENEEVHAAHILVKTKEEAEAALKKLKKGANFSELAKEISQDAGSKAQGGDLGFFPKGRMVPAFENAAFTLKPGELSEPIQTQFGFHIIKVLDKKGGQRLSLDASQAQIQQKLLQEKQKTTFDALLADLKSKAKISIHDDLLNEAAAPAGQMPPAAPAAPATPPAGKK
jgi:peptidyl-prolyl cis-trans isomerase C